MVRAKMTVGDLKRKLQHLPDDAGVLYQDPNFPGPYHQKPELTDFSFDEELNAFLISFPLEDDVNALQAAIFY